MITNYTKYLNENYTKKLAHKDFVINELCFNIEHDCSIDLNKYEKYCTFNILYTERDSDDLHNNFLKQDDYQYIDDYIEKSIIDDCKISILKNGNVISERDYLYLSTIIYNNFILSNEVNTIYYDEVVKINRLKISKYDYISYILSDIKNNIDIKNLENLKEFCKEYFKDKNMKQNIYFKELLSYLNDKELLDEYNTFLNAKNFDLI